jgi:hypothetical protein
MPITLNLLKGIKELIDPSDSQNWVNTTPWYDNNGSTDITWNVAGNWGTSTSTWSFWNVVDTVDTTNVIVEWVTSSTESTTIEVWSSVAWTVLQPKKIK